MSPELALLLQAFSAFWKIIFPYVLALKAFILQFWPLVIPFIIHPYLGMIYHFFITDKWDNEKNRTRIVLEIKVPQDLVRPIRAMEAVFNAFWGSYDPPSNWKPRHFDGKKILGASYELVGIDGIPHFFIRLPISNRRLLESIIYSQYPEVEITEVSDYVKNVPQDIPNKEWDLWGCDFMPADIEDDPYKQLYPIKTYEQFFEEKPDVLKEEKRIDPIASFFETISRASPGEQLWVQIWGMPISGAKEDYFDGQPFFKAGRKLVDKLAKRPEKPKFRSLIEDFFNLLFGGEIQTEAKKEDTFLPPEMKLTAGERDIVAAVERKISKNGFYCFARYIYIAKRKVFFGSSKGFGIGFFSQFATQHMNNLKPMKKTITTIRAPSPFTARRLYIRKRDLFDKYSTRDPAFNPFPAPKLRGAMFLLSVEELATMYHFPGAEAVPTSSLKRIEMKKGAPPMELPTE